MKTCHACSTSKPLDNFKKDNKRGTYAARCKACDAEARKGRREKENATRRKWYAKHSTQAERKRARVEFKYKMTLDEYTLFLSQPCMICGGKSTAVDHDHSCCPNEYTCGQCVRGALCDHCNKMLGMARDNTDILRKAINYLER